MFLITTTLKSIPTATLSERLLVVREFLQTFLPNVDHNAIIASLPLSIPPRPRRRSSKWAKSLAAHTVLLSPVVESEEMPESPVGSSSRLKIGTMSSLR
jgi:hypothetical protein